jgi:hypothetical protein
VAATDRFRLQPIGSRHSEKLIDGGATKASDFRRSVVGHHELIVELAARNRLPAVYAFRYFAAGGAGFLRPRCGRSVSEDTPSWIAVELLSKMQEYEETDKKESPHHEEDQHIVG